MNKKEIVKVVVDRIESAPVGSRGILSTLVRTYDKDGRYVSEDSMFDILNAVTGTLRKNGRRWLDYSQWDNMHVGQPFNLEFIIRDSVVTPEVIVEDDSWEEIVELKVLI